MNKRIRVLHTEWSNGWGGQEIRIINEMNAVREKGVEVFLACREDAVIKNKALDNNIQVFTLSFRGNIDFKTVFDLVRIIKKYSIDIVNTHSGKDTWVSGLAAKLAGIKFIRTRHLSHRISSSRSNFINELADYVFTTGESVREDMIKYNRIKSHKIESIPTGIDSTIFNPDNYDIALCRQQFNLRDDEIAIGILAVLRKFKRHDLFLKMAKAIIDKYSNKKFVFIIAGDGPQKNSIQKIINDLNLTSHIIFLGHVDKVSELLSALDILVLSSDSKEGVPQSVMQGLFMNKSVVATNSGSTKDLLNNNNFQLVGTDSSIELVNGVSYYIDNNKIKSNRTLIDEKFSLNFMSKKIVGIYNHLLS
ncbi:glycosyltransferase [Candidatus Pseudothioglobus singularis]|nr:glycosyltransferase [Candidatus Pseudothioglobus singularis]